MNWLERTTEFVLGFCVRLVAPQQNISSIITYAWLHTDDSIEMQSSPSGLPFPANKTSFYIFLENNQISEKHIEISGVVVIYPLKSIKAVTYITATFIDLHVIFDDVGRRYAN
jgi:hypothetical protein